VLELPSENIGFRISEILYVRFGRKSRHELSRLSRPQTDHVEISLPIEWVSL